MNTVNLIGRMTKTPDLRYSQSGTPVCSFTIAINRFGKKDEADFPNIVCFKKTAENTANFCQKGSLVGIVGRIQTRTYDGQNGKVYVTEVVAESVQFLEPKGQANNQNSNPSNNTQQDSDPFSGGQPIDISSDDLPF